MIKKKFFVKYIILSLLMFFYFEQSKATYQKKFFDRQLISINGENINLANFKNKVVLLVNVASKCGFTKQYSGLQNLWEKYKEKGLIVLAIPSKSFNQELNTNQEVKKFCEINYSIDFPMTSIYDVKGNNAHEIYKWAKLNYGQSAVPKWNFHKILINKEGNIVNTFGSFTNPESKKIIKFIENLLN